MKKGCGLLVILAVISVVSIISIISMSIVFAGFELGVLQSENATIEEGYDLDMEYGPRSILAGRLNISLTDEPFDSLLEASFDDTESDQIILKQFLINAGASYSCSSQECDMTYQAMGSGTDTSSEPKTISIGSGQSKLIGFKIQGDEITDVTDFTISIATTAAETCDVPLKIDLLNDGFYEWRAYQEASGEFCSSVNNGYGCYDESQKSSSVILAQDPIYCSKINVSASPKIQVGANINVVEAAAGVKVLMSISTEDGSYADTCNFDAPSSSGESDCVVDISTTEEKEFHVCISVDSSNGRYELGSETNDVCGYSTAGGEYDFSIFAKPAKYAPIGSFDFSTEEIQANFPIVESLEIQIINFISDNYDRDCSNGCVIPINISSGVSQTLTLSDAEIEYLSGAIAASNTVYDLELGPSIIDMSYQELDLSKANLVVPRQFGDYDLTLSLGDEMIFEEAITVLETAVVDLVYPQKVPAAIDVIFKAYVSGPNVSTYTWDFGDNTSLETTIENTVTHKYEEIGIYTLTVGIDGEATRSFVIEVMSPGEYMDSILQESQSNIDKVKAQLNALPIWIKSYFEAKIDLNQMESELATLKTRYQAAGGSSTEYVDILNTLEALDIPSSLEITDIDSVHFLIDREIISLSNLELLGAGTSQESTEIYKNAIFEWFRNSLTVLAEKNTYSIYVDDNPEPVGSLIKLSVSPNQGELDNVYFVINEQPVNLKLKDSTLETKAVGQSTGIAFQTLASREIAFLLPRDVNILDIPVYFSPGFSELAGYVAGAQVGICNNNGICESERGENSSNCRADCKPWGRILLWLLIILLIGFIIYIVLQEWYKRRYESHLFKDKNELYNLINFIDNAEKQGLKKEEIYKKLMDKGWTKEQIDYAWKKYKGERTGMWEIPVLRPLEKLKLKREIAARRKVGQTGKTAPIAKTKPGMPASTKPEKKGIKGFFAKLFAKKGEKKPPIHGKPGLPGKPISPSQAKPGLPAVTKPGEAKMPPKTGMFGKQNIKKP